MTGRGTFLAGLIGFGVSLLTTFVSAALPIIRGPRSGWREAMIGVLPSAFLVLVFLVVMLLGMYLMMSKIQRDARRHRGAGDHDAWDEEPPRRPRPAASDEPSL